jgi:hypothetical protein
MIFSSKTARREESRLNRRIKERDSPLSFFLFFVKFFDVAFRAKSKLRLAICTFARNLGVNKVIFNNKGKTVNGTYNGRTKVLYLNTNQTKVSLLRTFFHELGHHIAVQNDQWLEYHLCLLQVIELETMFNIENNIDKIGEQLWYKHVDIKRWGRYKYCYPKSNKNFFIKNYTSK